MATNKEQEKAKAARFGAAFRQFDKGLMNIIDETKKKLNCACDNVAKRVKKVEKALVLYVNKTKALTERDLDLAELLLKKELRSKIIMSQWTQSFLSATSDDHLDPVSYAFARFALNVCMCYSDVTADYLIESRVHYLLVSLMKFESEIISGPAIMACCHISLYPEVKPELILAGILPILLNLLVASESQPILTQACKLCASLALHPPNKSHMASSGCFHALFDLTGGAHKVVNRYTQHAAATAIVNIVYNSDANRQLSIELDGIRPLISAIRLTSNDDIILQAVQAIVNIAYYNPFTSSRILAAGGDTVLIGTCRLTLTHSLTHSLTHHSHVYARTLLGAPHS